MELVMDRRIVWNANNLKEVDEAKAVIRSFVKKGYEVLLATGEKMLNFRPYYEEVVIKAQKIDKRIMKILCENGDDRIIWDKDNGREAKEAKAKFLELLKKGYKAYSVSPDGKKHRRIHEFDVDAQEVLMVPATAKG